VGSSDARAQETEMITTDRVREIYERHVQPLTEAERL
jgi:hypothetical protein